MLIELSVSVPNRYGELARVLNELEVVNIQAFSIEDARECSITRLIVDDPNRAYLRLGVANIQCNLTEVIGVVLGHKRGQLINVAQALKDEHINMEHGFLTIELPRKKAIVALKTSDNAQAECVLTKAGFEVIDHIEEPLESFSAPVNVKANLPRRDLNKIKTLLEYDESGELEFKDTLRYNIKTGAANDKDIYLDIVKSINAFANRDGGVILIGVDDNGKVIGIDHDLATFPEKKIDKLMNFFSNDLVVNKDIMGVEYSQLLDFYPKTLEEKQIFVVEVEPSNEPVYARGGDWFYIREGSIDKRLSPRETVTFIKLHWGIKRGR